MAIRGSFTLLLAALSALSCAKPGGSFTPDRFVHEEHAYEVRYLEEGPENLLGKNWRLDNYVWSDDEPTRPKQGEDYVVKREYDMDDDGKVDAKAEEPYYDLLLEHRRKDAKIWLRSVPISRHDVSKELAVFADKYVEAASGSGNILVQFGVDGALGSVGKRFASRLLSRRSCQVSGSEAYRVDFEIANVDQLELSPAARWSRNRIVFVRTPFHHRPGNRSRGAQLPVLMVAGFRATPEDFDALSADFDRMLDRIVIAENMDSLVEARQAPHTCRSETVPAAPAASAPPPAAASGQESAPPDASTAPGATPAPVAAPASPEPSAPESDPAPQLDSESPGGR